MPVNIVTRRGDGGAFWEADGAGKVIFEGDVRERVHAQKNARAGDFLVAPQFHVDEARSWAAAGWKRQRHPELPITQAPLDVRHLRIDHGERVVVTVMGRASI